ncbi:MAG: extracellular solute-binding protein, family 7 [Chloroflexi bacterium]|nr:extracellular solute-binding protein, family 7 [Chloroflexota bacterium]
MKKLPVLLSVLVILSLVLASAISCSSSPSPTPSAAPPASSSAPPTTQAAAPAGTTIALKIATYMPATNYVQTQQFPAYFKLVEEATKGKYTFKPEFFPVGTLLAPPDIHDGVAKGIADVGQMATEYTPGRFPVMSTLLVSGVAPQKNCNDGARTGWEFYKKYQPQEFKDVKVLYTYGIGPGALHSSKAVKSVADMKGLKIRGAVRGVQALGAEPFNVPMGEVYESVKKGLFEAMVGPAETLKAWKLNEIFHYSTLVPGLYFGLQTIIMNKNTYQGLPEDLRAAIDSVSDAAAKRTGEIWEYYQQEGYEYAKSQPGGHEIIELPASEIALMNDKFKPVIADYIKTELDGKGFPGQQMVQEAGKIAAESVAMTYGTWKP